MVPDGDIGKYRLGKVRRLLKNGKSDKKAKKIYFAACKFLIVGYIK